MKVQKQAGECMCVMYDKIIYHDISNVYSTVTTDDLETRNTGASIAMVSAWFPRYIPVSTAEWLKVPF